MVDFISKSRNSIITAINDPSFYNPAYTLKLKQTNEPTRLVRVARTALPLVAPSPPLVDSSSPLVAAPQQIDQPQGPRSLKEINMLQL